MSRKSDPDPDIAKELRQANVHWTSIWALWIAVAALSVAIVALIKASA